MPDAKTFTYDQVYAAMCIMEEIADPTLSDAGEPWEAFREAHGIHQLRDEVIHKLATPCDADWERTYKAYEASCNDDADARDPGSFDYEFVPAWLRLKVDWSDVANGPRVRGSANG